MRSVIHQARSQWDFLVVGAGFTGAVLAERIASQLGLRVLLVERRDHVGGNAHDRFDANGVLVHPYGPHIFHTNSPKVAAYLSVFTKWRPYEHRVRGLVDESFVPLPFNLTAMELVLGAKEGARINKMLTDEFGTEVKVPILNMRRSGSAEVRRIADLIYEKVFLHYTVKQWGLRPEELDASVTSRVPVHLSRDDRYFQDSFQQMPADGYASLFARLLDHPLIEVRTGVSFKDVILTERINHVVYTGPIDEFFDYSFGPLPYRSIRFDMRSTAADEPLQGTTVENYPTPATSHPYTRSTEFRLLTAQDNIGHTTQAFEYPEDYVVGANEPYYPVPREENRDLFRKYAGAGERLRSVTFAGRLADYSYYNMDQAVGRALSCFEKEIAPSWANAQYAAR
jgi:UDP-galactopyranose mutase